MNKKSAVFIGMGFECVGLVLTCVYIGRWLDTNYGWKGLGASAGAFIGIVGWVTHVLIVVRQLAKEEKQSHTDSQ